MKIPDLRLPAEPAQEDDLLDCRMLMLGLDRDVLALTDIHTLSEIMRRCVACGQRDACSIDLKRDPNNPVWETYCPNAPELVGLTKANWVTH